MAPLKVADIEDIVKENKSIIIDSSGHDLRLSVNGKLGQTNHAIVWKAIYDKNITVAVKIVWDKKSLDKELNVFEALNAGNDSRIENYGIPKIYYSGTILNGYHAIVMTLFDGTLNSRLNAQNGHISDLSILMIFKRTVSEVVILLQIGIRNEFNFLDFRSKY